MWPLLLRKYWALLALVIALIGAAVYLRQSGYSAGYAASEAQWQRRYVAAERARDEANARAAILESRSNTLSAETETRHAQTIASLNARAADAERRTAHLVRQLAARARCGAVPEASGPASEPDAAPASDPVADRAAADLVQLARRCESDASTLAEWQRWYTEQRAISPRP